MSDDEKAYFQREADIVQAAIENVKVLEPFYGRPAKKNGDILLGWLWAIQRQKISPEIAEAQLRSQAKDLLTEIRARLWQVPSLSVPRAAVLLHVGLLIGSEKLLGLTELWDAVGRADYDTAQDVLLINGWAEITGNDPASKRRTLALARILRTGEPPKARIQ